MNIPWDIDKRMDHRVFQFPPDGSAWKDNNASTLQFKTKYMVVFKTI